MFCFLFFAQEDIGEYNIDTPTQDRDPQRER